MRTSGRLRIAATLLALMVGGCGGSSGGGAVATPPVVPPVVPPQGPLGGLDIRPSNLSCLAPTRSGTGVTIALSREFQNLSFSQPLAMLQAPNDSTRWFVLEKTGRVRVFANDPTTTSFAADFIDLTQFINLNTNSEGGLLGMAFHPNFAANGRAIVSWTENTPMVSVVAGFTSQDGGQTLGPGTQSDLIRLNQDFENHNGGQVAFGPDGNLYIGFGDGGSGSDPNSRAQNTTNLLGAMLRVDVDSAVPYAIPSDNPFASGAMCGADPNVSAGSCAQIYAWGLRNPWRWSFDTATSELWLGDVGQGAREEIDRIERGGNYGWDCREGAIAFGSPATSCSSAGNLVDPVHDYPRGQGSSVTGGYVYRGAAIPALLGSYLFADFGSGRIWRLVDDGQGGFDSEELLDTNFSIASFGQADDGELYVVDIGGGLYRITAGSSTPPAPPVPSLLSATGCFDSNNPSIPVSGTIPYEVNAPFWSDGADKERWLALPDGTAITVGLDGDFSFPPGSVLLKHFRLSGQLIETRMLMRHPDGGWAGYTYEWDSQQSDATLVTGGHVSTIGSQDWIFPSENDCTNCHTAAAGFSLGVEVAQLNSDLTYASTGRTANQLRTLDAVSVFAAPLGDPSVLAALADPQDSAASLETRARAYLHTNCAQCHRPLGPTPSSLDLRFDTSLSASGVCAAAQAGDLGLGAGAMIVAPGNPALSVLVERMDRRDANGMPPLASNLVDSSGLTLIRDWISSLSSCP
jgi:uncharacterized repeat protein (TIGR03806 family)